MSIFSLQMGRIHYSERAGTGTPATASYSAATDQVGSFFSDEVIFSPSRPRREKDRVHACYEEWASE
uniref:Uncharacterized protein n=1 Tax=Oryza nivara TaxID=4536 RepID=A0A0E0IRF8_ORYNI